MTGAGNQEHAETVGLGPSIIIVAQLVELPAQMERFLDLNFLVVPARGLSHRILVSDEVVKQGLWHWEPEMAIWTREELVERMGKYCSKKMTLLRAPRVRKYGKICIDNQDCSSELATKTLMVGICRNVILRRSSRSIQYYNREYQRYITD